MPWVLRGRTWSGETPIRDTSAASPAARDLREQVIIAFFGRHNLLNVQAGGIYASYAPNPSDIDFLKSPTSRFFQNFAQWSKPVPRAMIEQLKHWKDYIADLVASNPQSTRSAVLPLPAKTLNTIFGQAVPSQIGGLVPMVHVGLDITLEAYLDGSPFWSGHSQAGHIARIFTQQHAAYELGRDDFELDVSAMPFVDVFPWPCKADLDLGLAQLMNYLGIVVLPILVIAPSHLSFSCAMANWLHPFGIGLDTEIFSHVGKVNCRYLLDNDYLEDETQLEPPRDREVLVIDHVHPGYDKYGTQPQELRRVFDICHTITWFVAGVVVEKSHLLAQGRPDGRADRAAVIDEVMKTLDLSSRFSDLEQKCDAWVAEYQLWVVEHRAQYRPRMGTAVASGVRKAGARRRVSNIELAWGDVGSAERQRQLVRVWKLQNPEYFLCLERPVTWEKWEQWGGGVAKGNSYFATALAQAGRQLLVAQGRHPLRSVLLAFTPDEMWMADPVAVQRALSTWSHNALAHRVADRDFPADHWSSKKQRARTLKKGTIFLDRLEGEVAEFNFSNRKCEILLRRHDTEVDNDFTFRLRLSPSFAPRAEGERRILHFLPGGVGLEDENGNFLQRDGFTPEEGIFRARDAVLGHRGDIFARIFAAERAALAPAAPARTATTTSTSTNTLAATATAMQLLMPPTGEPPVTSTTRKQKRTEAREQNISPGDGVWLLKQWVDWRCGFEKPITFNTLNPRDGL
ncbi:BZ3500_MvSof-1268-A1-R1_Chr5-1g07650 [Microbotryum saponariae]|uniref:BZ3500_MvSof-1268-A1-R1_Chr5-1g07650 protein n=1 Tax=Microbotryum saponariae TaxID=289078 RepID=A0A2X0LF25_9BASI|nr:BZ3500_MvSof-1268-A1-R1_Chr5-1g07650 [Microbotryum saponariae]SDA05521.1 BZ3501_MvSof-1269-A2-R1_Chr5-2g07474 [Microbotryum saponariae]